MGLEPHEISNLDSYLHFRPGFKPDSKLLVDRGEQYSNQIDVFEPVSRDLPVGVWSIQKDVKGIAILRSLLWPGFMFYHQPGKAGGYLGVYFGTGQVNDNVGYML